MFSFGEVNNPMQGASFLTHNSGTNKSA